MPQFVFDMYYRNSAYQGKTFLKCKKRSMEYFKNKIFINVINVAYQYLLYENNTFRSQGIKRKMFYQNKSREVRLYDKMSYIMCAGLYSIISCQ